MPLSSHFKNVSLDRNFVKNLRNIFNYQVAFEKAKSEKFQQPLPSEIFSIRKSMADKRIFYES